MICGILKKKNEYIKKVIFYAKIKMKKWIYEQVKLIRLMVCLDTAYFVKKMKIKNNVVNKF